MIYGDAGADPPRRASPGCSRRACDDAATRVQSCQLQQSVPLSLPSNPGCFMSLLLGTGSEASGHGARAGSVQSLLQIIHS